MRNLETLFWTATVEQRAKKTLLSKVRRGTKGGRNGDFLTVDAGEGGRKGESELLLRRRAWTISQEKKFTEQLHR